MICPTQEHVFLEILDIPEFLTSPIRTIGVQSIFGYQVTWKLWSQLDWSVIPTLKDLFQSWGHEDVKAVDFQDGTADLVWDLNLPVPKEWHDSANTIVDIGSIEHIADSQQVLRNYLDMLRVGGHVLIHTPVCCFFGHGLHTFSPEYIPRTLEKNGCEIVYEKYTNRSGGFMQFKLIENKQWNFEHDPVTHHSLLNVIGWYVAKKVDDNHSPTFNS